MYCKFCGNVLAPNSVTCSVCGANINFSDGGQSFFDDNELEAWRNDGLAPGTVNMPKTELKAPVTEPVMMPMMANPSAVKGGANGHPKKRLRLSNANKFIIFCISLVLVIVLAVVAVISFVGSDEEEAQNTAAPMQGSGAQASAAGGQVGEAIDEKEYKNITVYDMKGNQIVHNVPAYNRNESIYLCVDIVLEHEGYKHDGYFNGDNSRPRYRNQQTNRVIIIQKDGSEIGVIEKLDAEADSPKNMQMKGKTFNKEKNTYVPIREFLQIALGYDTANMKWDEATSTLYFSKAD